jgi:hypothetical protein
VEISLAKKFRLKVLCCAPLQHNIRKISCVITIGIFRAFTLASSNRIYTKIIATNPLNTPHQPRQTAIREKFFYSSSPKRSSHCSSTNQKSSILYNIFSLFSLPLAPISLSASREPRRGQIGLERAEIRLWKLGRPRTGHGEARSCLVIWLVSHRYHPSHTIFCKHSNDMSTI